MVCVGISIPRGRQEVCLGVDYNRETRPSNTPSAIVEDSFLPDDPLNSLASLYPFSLTSRNSRIFMGLMGATLAISFIQSIIHRIRMIPNNGRPGASEEWSTGARADWSNAIAQLLHQGPLHLRGSGFLRVINAILNPITLGEIDTSRNTPEQIGNDFLINGINSGEPGLQEVVDAISDYYARHATPVERELPGQILREMITRFDVREWFGTLPVSRWSLEDQRYFFMALRQMAQARNPSAMDLFTAYVFSPDEGGIAYASLANRDGEAWVGEPLTARFTARLVGEGLRALARHVAPTIDFGIVPSSPQGLQQIVQVILTSVRAEIDRGSLLQRAPDTIQVAVSSDSATGRTQLVYNLRFATGDPARTGMTFTITLTAPRNLISFFQNWATIPRSNREWTDASGRSSGGSGRPLNRSLNFRESPGSRQEQPTTPSPPALYGGTGLPLGNALPAGSGMNSPTIIPPVLPSGIAATTNVPPRSLPPGILPGLPSGRGR